jgi:lipid II:glycine glycyltransferase (peptidoglycan interpeptide bridge formation enzyme)
LSSKEKDWDDFVVRQGGSFLQSASWGKFQKSFGRQVWQLAGEGWQGQCLKHSLPFGFNYLYVPRGPVVDQTSRKASQNFKEALRQIKHLARAQKSVFVKIEPPVLRDDLTGLLIEGGFCAQSRAIQPRATIVVDIAQSEQDLADNLKPKTRYNLRLAIRHRVKVRAGATQNDFEEFWRLVEATSLRQRFKSHPKSYYESMVKNGAAEIFLAEYKDQSTQEFKIPHVLAAALVNFFDGRATYLHGASSYEYRQLMAPYLLHWRIMREAKRRGFLEYDLWGVDAKRWPGFTRFKQGWGGRYEETPGAFDLPLRPVWYQLYLLSTAVLR